MASLMYASAAALGAEAFEDGDMMEAANIVAEHAAEGGFYG